MPLGILFLWIAVAGKRNRKELLLIVPLFVVAAPLVIGVEALASFDLVPSEMFVFVEVLAGIVFAVAVLHVPFDFLACSSSKLSFFKSGMVLIFMGTLFTILLGGLSNIQGGVSVAIVMAAMVLAALPTRYFLRRKQNLNLFFPIFLGLFALVCAIPSSVLLLIMFLSFEGFWGALFPALGGGIASAFFAVLIWMALTPFMLLDVFVPTFRNRFSRLLWTPPAGSVEESASAGDEVAVEA